MTALARFAARLEHRLTLPTDSLADLDRAVALVTEHELSALIVSPWLVKPARRLLGRSPVRLATVVGGDHGGEIGAVKAYEASRALEHGAVSLDCVLNAGALISGDDETVLHDLLSVIEMAHAALARAGVVIEAALLPDELVRRACRLAERAGADHVVGSSGDASPLDAIAHVRLLRESLGPRTEVKAAARFAELDELLPAVAAGASCISTAFTDQLARAARAALSVAGDAGGALPRRAAVR
jgi:deoxyribose-phosphate aldolase